MFFNNEYSYHEPTLITSASQEPGAKHERLVSEAELQFIEEMAAPFDVINEEDIKNLHRYLGAR